MTDGRIPGRWISDPRYVEMDDAVFGFLARAIAWSNEAGTDGALKTRYLGSLHCDGERHPAVYDELERLGLWKRTNDGYQFHDWEKPAHQGGLGQSLAATVRNEKAGRKKRQQAWRDRQKEQTPSYRGEEIDDSHNALRDPLREEVSYRSAVGQDRTGQDSNYSNPSR